MTFKSFKNADLLSQYMVDKSIRQSDVQKRLMEATLNHPRNMMMGAPEVLQLTSNLIQLIGGTKILDIGVYTGASALSAALAIPDDGKVYAIDITDEFLKIGQPFWKEAGVEHKIELRIAPATQILQMLLDEGHTGTFDLCFIDADKINIDNYYELSYKLIRKGGIIVIDNTIWSGNVINPEDQSEGTKCIRKLNDKLKDDKRINLSLLLIGDGLTLCFKK